MKLKDFLKQTGVVGDLIAKDKKSVLNELANHAVNLCPELGADDVLNVLLEREKLGSTGVGNGVAIPHGKMAALNEIVAVFGRSPKGIDFQSHDHKPANLFFVLLSPESVVSNHLQALARLSRLLKEEEVRKRLIEAKSENLYQTLIMEDEKI